MSAPKLALAGFWVVSLVALTIPGSSTVLTVVRLAFGCMVVVHIIECFVFAGRIRSAGGSTLGHTAQVFLFGFVHLREIPPSRDTAP